MEIYVRKSPLASCEEPLLVVGLTEGPESAPAALAGLDEASAGLLGRVLESGEFRGSAKECRVLHVSAPGAPERVLLLGLGKPGELTAEGLRRAVAGAATEGRKLRAGSIAFALPLGDGLPVPAQARAIVESAILALYEFRTYRSKPPEDDAPVTRLTLVDHDEDDESEIGAAVSLGRLAAESACLCRDLGNTPAIDATPTFMAERAAEIAGEVGLALTVLGPAEMEEHGMGGLLGVASGSEQPPRLVVLEHNADREDLPTVCLVGKGITFDTGGISIKPAANMGTMKFDKAGACAVLAAMRAVALLDPPLRVVGIAPFAENMPSGSAYRPGDVLTCSNGKTIEVLNTDAEGRLILADALVWATRYEPAAIVDLATLTGACVVALGDRYAGMMANDDGLAARLDAAGEATGERLWRLPLHEDYREQLESNVADMKNIGGRPAGAVTAACLLSEFVADLPWAHLDIAGVALRETDRDYQRKGGTGFGVRLLIEFLGSFGSEEDS